MTRFRSTCSVLSIAAALIALGAAGCTPAARADIALAGNVAPVVARLVCAGISAAGQAAAGTACGSVASDVSAVSALVQSILDSLPPAAAKVLPTVSTPAAFVYRGVAITLPSAELAAAVQARLPAAAAATSPTGSR